MIDVTCAIIRNDEGCILVVQRGEAGDHPLKWEFPGGKVEDQESFEDCIIREIDEELSMGIVLAGRLPAVEFDYGHKQIRLIPFICDTLDVEPILNVHVSFKWIQFSDLMNMDFSEADIEVARFYREKYNIKEVKNAEVKRVKGEPEIITDTKLEKMVSAMHGTKEVTWVAESACQNPAMVSRLVELSFSGDRKLAFHSSWVLTKISDMQPEAVFPYLREMILSLNKLENESAVRSFLRIISFSEPDQIDEDLHGILTDYCFEALRSGTTAIAVKVYSMEILGKLALKYPELINELASVIAIVETDGSAGIAARGRILIRKLSRSSVK